MEVRVHLKICEGCGCLWYRMQNQGSVYCKDCRAKLREFPAPDSRKRRGRPSHKHVAAIWAVAEALGGAQ
jgi:predicted amidophosphoribosyltransferase